MLLPRISTPMLELGSQVPRCVMICTLQLPSNDVRACAVPAAAAAAIATVMTVETTGGDIIFMTTTFEHQVHNMMTPDQYRSNPAWVGWCEHYLAS